MPLSGPPVHHISFLDLPEEEFKEYARYLVNNDVYSEARTRALAYLQHTTSKDKAAIAQEQAALNVKRQRQLQHQAEIGVRFADNDIGFLTAHASVFQEPPVWTDAQILAKLTVDNAEVYIQDRDITGTVVLSGDNVKFRGLGGSGSAVGGDLTHTCIVTGKIQISGSDVTLEGLHFKFDASWELGAEHPMISFSGGTNQTLTLKNCTFENTGSHADGRFLSGLGSGGGTQVIEGCRIKDFTSWMLLDATTNSGTPTVKIDWFTLSGCKIENCMGSLAVRGMQADPNGQVSFYNNLVAFGANGQHASFWDCFEANNTLRVICTGNTVTGATHGANRGFLQCWSRSGVPWTVKYKSNTITNFGAGVRIACNATFYCPNTYDVDFLIKSKTAQHVGVTYGGSFVYPYTDATQVYAPENLATFPEPTADFAGLSNFSHA